MKQVSILTLTLLLLVLGAGCIDSEDTNTSENITPAPILHYERGNISISINTSEIPMRRFDVNVTEVIEIALVDQRAGILLENGWNITSVRTGFEEEDPDQKHIDVEFRNDELPLSFFIEVDELERQAGKGRCNVPYWEGPYEGPRPDDYHKAMREGTDRWYVYDHHNERVAMVYNETTISYLYPSYGKE